jgi:glutamate--cysteine ligase
VSTSQSVKDLVHNQLLRNPTGAEDWFRGVRRTIDIPFYSSYDIRDSGQKIANVDANIYPAGFNNICPVDRENCGDLVRSYVERHYGADAKRVLILTEEHTGNPYYWDNVATLQTIIADAGLEVKVAFPNAHDQESFTMQSASRGAVQVNGVIVREGQISVRGFIPDLVVSNNDFSLFYDEWGPSLRTQINPPRELGWYQRKKSTYFKHYNQLCDEFARVIEIDPWLLKVDTELFDNFDIANEDSREALATKVDAMINRLKNENEKRGIQEEPFVFIKNNSGTYGLGVIRVQNGFEVKGLNNRTRKKMKAAKGGREIEEVIIQEGVRSIVRADGITAEPTLYLLGCQLAGGFLRSHAEKDETESLNSPGAVYKRLCVSDLKVSTEGHPMENVYGWIARLGVLAIGRESAEMGVNYNGYARWTNSNCGT